MAQIRVDWLYALSLAPGEGHFDFSVLSDFRQRLLEQGAQDLLLEPILQVCRERGWLKERGKQRTDATLVLARIRSLSSLESVGESIRSVLNSLAEHDPDWLLSHLDEGWFDRYVHRFELARFPKEESKRQKLREDVGQDAYALLSALEHPQTPPSLQSLGEVGLLRQIFEQHYQVRQGQAHWRDGPAVLNAERVLSPYDPDARSSRKRETSWDGYKVHVTETCDQDPTRPHLVVQVHTAQATEDDSQRLPIIQQQARQKGLVPKEHYVDQGYPSGAQVIEQRAQGTEIMGPVPAAGGWQAAEHTGYAATDFQIDWEHQQATCPQGQKSVAWVQSRDKRQQPTQQIRFSQQTCQGCPAKADCTKGTQQGRTLNLPLQPVYEALQQRRAEQFTPAFLQRYAVRAGIEATISQGVRGLGLRQTPYMGLQKTHGHHLAIAAGINLLRIEAHLQAQAQGKPTRPSRRRTPFARFYETWKGNAA
jgi:transposase